LVTGVGELAKQVGDLTALEIDLLTLAAAVFAVDLAAQRGERERITRGFHLTIPVVHHQLFADRADDLADILWVLSGDNWEFAFTPRTGQPEGFGHWTESTKKTVLFSGGLDSLAAVVGELAQGAELVLASHYTRNPVTQKSQQDLLAYLESAFPGRCTHRRARLTGESKTGGLGFPSDNEREFTQRSRSFAFLVIGAIAARRAGSRQVLMIAENGQMAIHLPLTTARIGAFSTHTAHPEFIAKMQAFLGGVLSFPFEIRNPFLYKTKAECIAILAKDHPNAIPQAVSCWKSARIAFTHCGYCIPCLIRRIALEHHGIRLAEYGRDLLAENAAALAADDEGKRNLSELAEFMTWFGGGYSDADLEEEFPDLISEYFDREQAVTMYKRFAAEARAVLSGYPGAASIL
jgi:7-cyano-7-deazaguanine synthase in queuosine biosynthesis